MSTKQQKDARLQELGIEPDLHKDPTVNALLNIAAAINRSTGQLTELAGAGSTALSLALGCNFTPDESDDESDPQDELTDGASEPLEQTPA